MSTLDEFLDNGSLPFTGRERERARIVEFWRAALHGDGMRVLLIEGEAGVGKSRLVQEAAARIEAERGTVVHAKLYAELTSAIAPLLEEALARTELGRQVARGGSLAGAVEALRRIARLRPTIVIIEDVHLLAGAPVRELVQLFEAIEEEPVAVLLTARTQEHPVRRVLERWPLETVALPPLARADVEALWRQLFGDTTDVAGQAGTAGDTRDAEQSTRGDRKDVEQRAGRNTRGGEQRGGGDAGGASTDAIAQLVDATLCNPLALRSALRGALRREALRRDETGAWRAEASFASVSTRSATSLVEGMLAGLSDADRRMAARLASLGEVFSREAASTLLDDAAIGRLFDAGLVHELAIAKSSLPGLARSATAPLAFSHSLVHRALADAAEPDVAHLVRLLADAIPLYSIEPFALVASRTSTVAQVDIEITRDAIGTALTVALELDKTSDWALALTAHRAAETLFELEQARWSSEELRERSLAIAARRLALMRRQMPSPEYGEALERFTALLRDLPDELLWYRLTGAIASARRRYLIDGYAAGRAVYDEVRAIVDEHPELRTHQQYVLVLQSFAQFAAENDDTPMRREIEREYRTLVADPRLDESHRILAATQVPPYLLTLFESAEELAERERMYAELRDLERNPSPMARLLVHAMLPSEPAYLARTGRIDELVALVDSRLEMLRAQGMMVVHLSFRLYRLWAEILLGLDATTVLERLRSLVDELERTGSTAAIESSADIARLVSASLVRGDLALGRAIVDEHAIDVGTLPAGSAELLDRAQSERGAGIQHDAPAPRGVVSPGAIAAAFEGLAKPLFEIDGSIILTAHLDVMAAAAAATSKAKADAPTETAAATSKAKADAPTEAAAATPKAKADAPTEAAAATPKAKTDAPTEAAGAAPKATADAPTAAAGASAKASPTASAALSNQQINRARAALGRALEWLEERRLDVVMRSMLERHGVLLAAKDLAAWRRRATAITAAREAQRAPVAETARLRISMLGRIEIRRPGESEPMQPRGARQKSFLGAMVARELLARPLDRDEFLEAAGIERSDDPKLSRDAVNSAIYRLRDLIGHESVLTDEETPRLNMEIIDVDLVDALRSVRNAEEALRRGSLALASRSMLDALDTVRGEVPFPALYETFFEAMREDLETRLRAGVLAVARRLLAEADAAGAGALLERCFALTPEDEEIAELYCAALEQQGRRTEAERVRWKIEAEAG